jgi:membrane associated rhomboid family serine protease
MIPIGDDIPTRRIPVVNYVLIAVNLLVFLFELSLGPQVDQLFRAWGTVPARITSPARYPWAFITLFTAMFLHGGWSHFLGNMVYLWIFGDNVEDRLGHGGYTAFYLVAGVVAGLAQVFVAPQATIPGIGASGAIAGVLAVYLLLYPTAPVRVLLPMGRYFSRIVRVPAFIVLGIWFLLQLFNGVLSLGSGQMAMGGVAWFAHIGGFVTGLVLGAVLRGRGEPPRPPTPPRRYPPRGYTRW